jgi:hypothetical protein
MSISPITLASTTLSADDDRAGGPRWKETVTALYRLWRRDMRDVRDQRKENYPKTWDGHQMRSYAFIHHLVRELATLYRIDPKRTFLGDSGELPETIVGSIEVLYSAMDINERMSTAHEMMCATGNCCVMVVPGSNGQPRVILVPAHDVAVDHDLQSSDIGDVKAIWVRMPVAVDPYTGLTTYGVAKITREEALWEQGPGELKGKGLWFEDASNPLAEIPLVTLRSTQPGVGEYFSPAPQDLLDCARALSEGFTDIGVISRLQSFGQAVMVGANHQSGGDVEMGPESVIALQDESMDFKIVSSTGAGIKTYMDSLDQYMKSAVAANGLNPGIFFRNSSSLTSLARRYELIDRDSERRRMARTMANAEQGVYDLIAAWVNVLRSKTDTAIDVLPPAKVKIDFRSASMPVDILHEAQADEINLRMKLTTPAEILAGRLGISVEEARERISSNRQEAESDNAFGLNGSQVTVMTDIAARVAAGEIPRASGIELLKAGFGLSSTMAEAIIP